PTSAACCPWPMPAPTPTAASSSSPTWPRRGWTASTRCSARSSRAWKRSTRSSRATISAACGSRAMPTPCWPQRPIASPNGTASWRRKRAFPQGGGPAAGRLHAKIPGCQRPFHEVSMPQFASRIGRAKPSAIMEIAEKAKRLKSEGRDIISFSIGVPNFLPGEHVYAAARDSLSHDSGQYGSNRGNDALLDAFLAHIAEIGLEGYGRSNVATGIGAKHVIYNLAEALLEEGDTIAFPVPYWTSYLDIAEIVNAKVLLLPCPAGQDYKLTPAQLDAALAQKPKVFLFNNPSNPTGMVYSKEEISALADVVARYPDTWVITDD